MFIAKYDSLFYYIPYWVWGPHHKLRARAIIEREKNEDP